MRYALRRPAVSLAYSEAPAMKKESGQHMIPVGFFEDGASLVFKGQVFIDEKPEYYEFANKTEDFTGAEIFAMFGSS